MRKAFFMGLVLVTAILACGDKLMLLPANARFRQIHGAHPIAILIYMHPNSTVSEIARTLQLALKRAGHKFDTVDDLTGLDKALKNGKYDLLLADVNDAEFLRPEARLALSKPVLLPVVYKSSKAEAAAVEKRFHCVLKAPGSPGRYLEAIDDALEVKLKANR
jgi:hypothetical protein